MNLEKLFEEKENLIEEYCSVKNRTICDNNKYLEKKYDLILNTDFQELGLTNQKSRDAYVDNELKDMKLELTLTELKLEELKLKLSLIDDKINYAMRD